MYTSVLAMIVPAPSSMLCVGVCVWVYVCVSVCVCVCVCVRERERERERGGRMDEDLGFIRAPPHPDHRTVDGRGLLQSQ